MATFIFYADHEDTGLLFGSNIKGETIVILAHVIHFANGVELSADGGEILIREASTFRTISISLSESRNALKAASTSSGWEKEPTSVSLI